MHIKITRTTVAAGRFVHAGQVIDLPDADARALMQLGKAEHVKQPDPVVETPMTTESAAPIVATDVPKPTRGKRK